MTKIQKEYRSKVVGTPVNFYARNEALRTGQVVDLRLSKGELVFRVKCGNKVHKVTKDKIKENVS